MNKRKNKTRKSNIMRLPINEYTGEVSAISIIKQWNDGKIVFPKNMGSVIYCIN